nr:PREDICTED: uncharacterized protein LOC106496153 [Apteryx mantelli mantelli]
METSHEQSWFHKCLVLSGLGRFLLSSHCGSLEECLTSYLEQTQVDQKSLLLLSCCSERGLPVGKVLLPSAEKAAGIQTCLKSPLGGRRCSGRKNLPPAGKLSKDESSGKASSVTECCKGPSSQSLFCEIARPRHRCHVHEIAEPCHVAQGFLLLPHHQFDLKKREGTKDSICIRCSRDRGATAASRSVHTQERQQMQLGCRRTWLRPREPAGLFSALGCR